MMDHEEQVPVRGNNEQLRSLIRKYWGYDEFRPLQREAMESVLLRKDSVVVLPTGGGKSLCYQVPALLMPGMALVVSPLISLMKDQVDALGECGIEAAAVHSAISAEERRAISQKIEAGRLKLLYVAPERLMSERMLSFLEGREISFIAIDEAHCISDWGHDFRPDYRGLGELRNLFPQIGLHAYTATATNRVREDIAKQLKLHDPEFFVGDFDRPNLSYQILRRKEVIKQILQVIGLHRGESGIIYCISRKQVESLASLLKARGIKALPYHAGMPDKERHAHQEAFIGEQIDIVVATIAFGMGIDKSNVRFVIHVAAPKSLENYQQETGRAGRDGLPADCCLFFAGNDFQIWRKLQTDLEGEAKKHFEQNIRLIQDYCTSVRCRHRSLVEHFGQSYQKTDCGACDVCLQKIPVMAESLLVAQKILSCVIRVQENFGSAYVVSVLSGGKTEKIQNNGHERLSTYGLLKDHSQADIRDWIDQLCSQQFLVREGEYRILKVTPLGRQILQGGKAAPGEQSRGSASPKLLQPTIGKKKGLPATSPRWGSGRVDPELFEILRTLRRELAVERGVAPFVIFGDQTLIELAQRRPADEQSLLRITGVGEWKVKRYGKSFLKAIAEYSQEHGLEQEMDSGTTSEQSERKTLHPEELEKLFHRGVPIEEVMQETGRARSTVIGYLVNYLQTRGKKNPEPWVKPEAMQLVTESARKLGRERMKPLFDDLGGRCSYDEIRLCLACLPSE